MIYGGTPGANGGAIVNPATGAAGIDVIPSSQFSAIAKKTQAFLPAIGSTANSNNYIAPNRTGLVNWSTTDRIDYVINPKNTLTMVAAIGRQASSNPVGQTTAGRNVGPIPFNYGQTYAPKTAVGIIEETYAITPHLVNQIKYGFARYNGPTFDADQLPAYSATTLGYHRSPCRTGLRCLPDHDIHRHQRSHKLGRHHSQRNPRRELHPARQRAVGQGQALVYVRRSNRMAAVQHIRLPAVRRRSRWPPRTETKPAGLNNAFSAITNTGNAYASFLIGQIDKVSFTQYVQQEYRHALPRYLALRSGQLEGLFEAHARSWPALGLLPLHPRSA